MNIRREETSIGSYFLDEIVKISSAIAAKVIF